MEYEKTLRHDSNAAAAQARAPQLRANVRDPSDHDKTEDVDKGHVNDGFETLERHVGPEVYQELLAVFLGHLSVQLNALHNAAATGDLVAARYVAHQINGNAPGFGAAHLDDLADRVLRLGQDQGELLQPIVDEIDKEVGRLQAAGAH